MIDSTTTSAVTEGARIVWKRIVARSYLDPMTLKYMCIFTPEEMERLRTMTKDNKDNSMHSLQAKLAASEAQNKKMREALRYYAEESNQNEDGIYVLSHDGWFDGTEHDGSEYIVPFDNGTTAQKALSSLLP